MKSSYDKRMVLEQMIARDGLSMDGKRIVLVAVADLSGQYDRRQVLTAYIVRYGLEPALREPFFATIRSISSNYDRREALTALAKKAPRVLEYRTRCSTPSRT